jgi:sugar phosphate isomerase/epimerase
MKLAFSTLPVPHYNAEELTALCQAHKMAAELRLQPGKEILKGDGLSLCNAGSSVCLFGYDPNQVAAAKALLTSLMEAGVPAMRVFVGNFTRRHDDPRRELDHEGIARALRELCEVGPEIWLETHNEYATGKSIAPLLKQVNHPRLGVIWDILHPIEDGEAPKETMAYIGKHIRHVHIKDARPNPDPAMHDWYYTPLGEGEMPIGEIVTLLREAGYDGYYSLEWESAWREELKGVCDDPHALLSAYRRFMENLEG